MRTVVGAAFGLLLGLTGGSQAQSQQAVVVELFTSQGCSSCPPADAFLGELAGRDDVIALALHIDYWDYIGWKDSFGSPAFSTRQRAYATAAGDRSVYTPQVRIGGAEDVIGSNPTGIADLIRRHQAAPVLCDVSLVRDGNSVRIEAVARGSLGGAVDVQLMRYIPQATVSIQRGELAGRTITYHNIVTSIETLKRWDGTGTFALTARAGGDGAVVVLLQRPDHGEIVAAARLR